MYPTVVSASLRLLSNTYPPFPPSFPPFCLSAPPEGDRPSSIPESFPRDSPILIKGLLLVDRGTWSRWGRRDPKGVPPKTAVSTPKEHHFPGYLYATYPTKWTIYQL